MPQWGGWAHGVEAGIRATCECTACTLLPLLQDKGLSQPAAALLIVSFGLGAIAGGIAGGNLGSRVYAAAGPAAVLRLFGALQAAAALPMLWIVLALPAAPAPLPWAAYAAAAAGGCIASLTGPNLKATLLNANPPGDRAAVFTVQALCDAVGKGVAPTAIGLALQALAGAGGGGGGMWGRKEVFAVALCGWVISGAVIALAGASAAADVAAAQAQVPDAAAGVERRAAPSRHTKSA
jgi:hypothetical protein